MNYKTGRWTKEEETQLLEYVNDEVSWIDISRELRRSISACKSRVKKIDKRIIEQITEISNSVEVQEETAHYLGDEEEPVDDVLTSFPTGSFSSYEQFVKQVGNYMADNESVFVTPLSNSDDFWDAEKDLDLLIHFYELSIDEAKTRYGRSYGQIASRLEYLVDSTEPEHIMQVMKATDTIRVKKLHLAALTEESWRVKRKVSKIRKLQTKIEKLTQSVLKNLRGDNNEQEQ